MSANSNKYTVVVIPENGASPKQFGVSSRLWACFVAMVVGIVVFGSLCCMDYYRLRNAGNEVVLLQRQVEDQKSEILLQRTQIRKFAGEMDSFKSTLASLYEFEKKVRLLANLEDAGDSDGFLAIGGSFPDDLSPSLPINARHTGLVREMNEQAVELAAVSVASENSFGNLVKYLEAKKDILACTPSVRPVKKGWYTSLFGYRKSPFTGLKEFHKGLDIGAAHGSPVVSTANGRVTFVGKKGGLGKTMVVDHGHGMVTRYAHLDKFLKKKGESVNRGEAIALVGDTGRSTGPHLHYEVRLNGLPINPQRYILN